MVEFLKQPTQPNDLDALVVAVDNISVRRWFVAYALLLLATCIPLVVLISRSSWSWPGWGSEFWAALAAADPAIKLLAFAVYISLCCTFLPLPANAIVAAMATRQAAVGGDLWSTVLLVASVGAIASTIANLNDYHLFTLVLRHRSMGKIRDTRFYTKAARWFKKSPFFIVALFNLLPIPIDVIRMLATTYRYPRIPFAGANLVGRFLRYGIMAFLIYRFDMGPAAAVVLLGVAIVLAGARLVKPAIAKLMPATAKE